MANNRLYLVDTETNEGIMLAKGFGHGWSWRRSEEEMSQWLDGRDWDCNYGNSDITKLILLTELEVQKRGVKLPCD